MSDRNKNTLEKWINPCGYPRDSAPGQHNAEGIQQTDEELLTAILAQTKLDLVAANKFKENFVSNFFSN